ncbi:conserved hypothetical protein [Streptomyces sviceus ATCC 29083]|uniref:Uncharacterized protein n=1 Tax=Streptomyces sviceus (strain ATCC 29083 / DSM 924 / JCM 4929 / NBRC 13980 / NCIMB 11184 / NRRL 5439 / UC 5370) TaxID=463191 RepID=B5I505_STRX2|nr:conserved hypothetical protein [Streptomyces sviceus ATCC 29083]
MGWSCRPIRPVGDGGLTTAGPLRLFGWKYRTCSPRRDLPSTAGVDADDPPVVLVGGVVPVGE